MTSLDKLVGNRWWMGLVMVVCLIFASCGGDDEMEGGNEEQIMVNLIIGGEVVSLDRILVSIANNTMAGNDVRTISMDWESTDGSTTQIIIEDISPNLNNNCIKARDYLFLPLEEDCIEAANGESICTGSKMTYVDAEMNTYQSENTEGTVTITACSEESISGSFSGSVKMGGLTSFMDISGSFADLPLQ